MKPLSTVLREENITKRDEVIDFVRNAELIRKGNKSKLDSKDARFTYSDSTANFTFGSARLYAADILVVNTGENSLENFKEKIKKLDNEIKKINEEKQDIEKKINFLKESGSEKFNDNEYRAYIAIQTMDKENLSDFEKAKIIGDLIK